MENQERDKARREGFSAAVAALVGWSGKGLSAETDQTLRCAAQDLVKNQETILAAFAERHDA